MQWEGPLTEYVGNKLTIHRYELGLGTVKFTQPILVQKLWEEYGLMEGMVTRLPAVAGLVLVKGDGHGVMSDAESKLY